MKKIQAKSTWLTQSTLGLYLISLISEVNKFISMAKIHIAKTSP